MVRTTLSALERWNVNERRACGLFVLIRGTRLVDDGGFKHDQSSRHNFNMAFTNVANRTLDRYFSLPSLP